MDLTALLLSLKLAFATTAVLVVAGAPLAYALVFHRVPGKSFFEALINLPIVLPPTVLGFYLLVAMGPRGGVGRAWEGIFGSPLLFTFTGIVVASIIYSLPFAVAPMKTAFLRIDPRLVENAQVLGLNPVEIFMRVIIPNSLAGIAASAILVFLHSIGEFGVILMVGGSIPGETKVASIAIFEAVEALRYRDAWIMSLTLVPVSYLFLLLVNRLTPEVRRGA
ncbi:MAG TPA: molybdate ABC transporter permease subunit [Deltaproteobacteria bacterium]|jgi:molybdate transport system permease protein|nr:molybdate ABC transporter permease subunit [Deltaproteobacteria bacterium]HOI08443.1 molybdate ABC transporter permease subunit [Deltaproteobacteria bacterium]